MSGHPPEKGLAATIRATPGIPCRPWPRHIVSPERWAALPGQPGLALAALWADGHAVHALLRDAEGMLAVSVAVVDGRYPALSPGWPAAGLFERAIADLWGHAATEARPWLDHGAWTVTTPLIARPPARAGAPPQVDFAEAPGLDQMKLGPLAGLMAPAGQFRLLLRGPALVRMEARLGYLHRGIPALMRGKSPRAASRFAARLSGAATVAHSIAFARAAEAACDTMPPPRAITLCAAMAEAERIASHLADIDALARAAGMALVAAPCQRHRAAMLHATGQGFGHRLMMDVVVPGGLATDLVPEGAETLRTAVAAFGRALPAIARLSEGLARRLEGLAVLPPSLAAALGVGGPVARASGCYADLRRAPGYRPYHDLNVAPVHETAGDAASRLAVLLGELRDSARMLRTLLADLPGGPTIAPLPGGSGEGFGWAEGPHGDIWTWLRLDGGQIAEIFPRDPGWLVLPAMAAAMTGIDVAELAIARASFGLSHAGMDL